MGAYAEKAVQLFQEGYNCSQSVFGAFAERYGIDRDTAMRLAASFGAGMGRLREVCGTVSAMCLIAGLESGSTDGADQGQKAANYIEVQELAAQFMEKYHTICCADLLHLDKTKKESTNPVPEARTQDYYKKRPCPDIIRYAAELIEERYCAEEA